MNTKETAYAREIDFHKEIIMAGKYKYKKKKTNVPLIPK